MIKAIVAVIHLRDDWKGRKKGIRRKKKMEKKKLTS